MAKIGVIGVGRVGSTTAFALSRMPYAEEIILIDPNKENTLGVAMDIEQGCYFQTFADVKPGTYADIGSLDFLVITAGVKPQIEKGGTRLTGMEDAYRIVDDIAQHIREKDFRGTLVIASNPLDVMTYAFNRLSGLPKERIIGTGCTLDTARYVTLLAKRLDIPRKQIHGFVLGEHGDTSFPAFSATTVSGERLHDWMVRKGKDLSLLSGLENDVRQAGYEIARRLGSTFYGIASAIARIISDLLDEQGEVLPVSIRTTAEDGLGDIAISLPYRVSKHGIERLPFSLNPEEQEKLQLSGKAIQSYIESLNIPEEKGE